MKQPKGVVSAARICLLALECFVNSGLAGRTDLEIRPTQPVSRDLTYY